MKTPRHIKITLVLFMLATVFPVLVSAQDVQGKIYYVSKSKVSTDFGQRQMSEAQKARIKERQNKASTKQHVLIFNNNTSLFSEEETPNQNMEQSGKRSGGGGMRQLLNNQDSGSFYKDLSSKEYVTQKEIYGKQFLIEGVLQDLNWQKTDEVKTIGKYLCFKATAQIPKENKSSDNSDAEETTTVVAWYTIEIPIAVGPGMFWGLPGVILELQTESIVYLCSKIELDLKNSIAINPPKKGKKVTQQEYNKILEKKAKEVKELLEQKRNSGRKG